MNAIAGLTVLERGNLGDTVYARIADALMKGRFTPGVRLTIRDLAQTLGISATPVRDAIQRLIQDEALMQKSAREVRVPVMTVQRYREIRKVRVRLEGLAARESALHAQPADVELLRAIVARNEEAIASGNWMEALELNQTFHFALAEIAEMEVLRGILNRLWLQMGPLIADAYPAGGRVMIDQHYPVVEAIAARDPDAAEQAIAADIGEAEKVILERLARARPEDDDARRRTAGQPL